MVQTSKRCKPTFLDPKDVDDGEVFEIVAVEIIAKADTKFQRSDRTILTIKRKGNLFRWGINNTTHDRCVDAFGVDTTSWFGQRVQVDKQLQVITGKERIVLYGIPLLQEKIAPSEKNFETAWVTT